MSSKWRNPTQDEKMRVGRGAGGAGRDRVLVLEQDSVSKVGQSLARYVEMDGFQIKRVDIYCVKDAVDAEEPEA